MYRYLWSNGPKECLEFADYTFEEHFGKPIASYPPRAVLWDYIEGRVKKPGVRNWIRFNTPVRMVEWDERQTNSTVTAHDRVKDTMYTEEFDHVIAPPATSRRRTAPFFEGLDTFNGRVLHAHDFRDALEFKGKDILIVGRSYSAEDIGSQCWKYGAQVGHRPPTGPSRWASNGPRTSRKCPLLQKVVEQDGLFQGRHHQGSRRHHPVHRLPASFPFPGRRSAPEDRQPAVAAGLYKGVVWAGEPEAVLPRHAGPVLHLQHVRRAGLVRPRRHHGPHQAAEARCHEEKLQEAGASARRSSRTPSR